MALKVIALCAFLAAAGSLYATAQSMPEPHVLQTAPQPPTPLGCRANRSQLLCAPTTDVSALPVVATGVEDDNPYRDNAAAAAIGRELFNQACAFCHGADADGARVPAPDLRRLDAHCLRIDDDKLRAWCLRDVDAYFRRTVLEGKTYIGIVHMPPWTGVLTPKHIWAIRTYIESRRPQGRSGAAARAE